MSIVRLTLRQLNILCILSQHPKENKKFNEINTKCLKALQSLKTQYGPDHSNVSAAQSKLGQLFKSQGNYDQAEAMIVDVLRIESLRHGNDHVSIASIKSILGDVHVEQKLSEQAEVGPVSHN